MCRVEEARVVMEDCNHGQKWTVLDTPSWSEWRPCFLIESLTPLTVPSQYWETDAAIQQYALTNFLN